MWVLRIFAFSFFALALSACGGKSVHTVGGEAGAGSMCEDTTCGGDCVDLLSDPRHCGGCFDECNSDERCIGGHCLATQACPPPTTSCNGQCVDLRFSQQNCGACGNACGTGSVCNAGTCLEQCPNGQCGGVCVDFASDPNNCGGCGYRCGPDQYCSNGGCVGFCDGLICGGSCVDPWSDPFNCGGCGYQCTGGDFSCVMGQCQNVCTPDSLFCNGVCVDWRSDPANCGGCGARCNSGQQCLNGNCVSVCETGTWCNGLCVDLSSDPNHCGQCFAQCQMPNFCSSGVCTGGTGTCGDRVTQPWEEADPPPGPLGVVPLNPRTCRYDFSAIAQWYCNGTCGNWGGGRPECDQLDADAFCKLKTDNARSTAIDWDTTQAYAAPGVCCPPPEYAPGSLGCTSLGVLASRGVNLAVSVHPSNLFSTHQGGAVITNLRCTTP